MLFRSGVAQQGYSNFYNDYLNRLAQASGATQNPANAVELGLRANQQNMANQQYYMGQLTQGLGNLSKLGFGSNAANTYQMGGATYTGDMVMQDGNLVSIASIFG